MTRRQATGRLEPGVVDRTVGGFFLIMAGINIGLVVADADIYRHFADASFLGFVVDGWRSVVMTHPALWIGLLAAAARSRPTSAPARSAA